MNNKYAFASISEKHSQQVTRQVERTGAKGGVGSRSFLVRPLQTELDPLEIF
jgi:hypothetical protein